MLLAPAWHFGIQRSDVKAGNASQASNSPPSIVPSTIAPNSRSTLPEQPNQPNRSQTDNNRPSEAQHPVNGWGSVFVSTDPPGATVKVSGAPELADKTPEVVTNLAAGQQTLEISMEGYDTLTLPIEVTQNETTKMDMVKLVRSTGKLRIMSSAPNLVAELKSKFEPVIDNHGATSFVLSDLPTGDYVVTVMREHWEAQSRIVKVVKDGDSEAFFEFPNGMVHIVSTPPGAKVILASVRPAQIGAASAPDSVNAGTEPAQEGTDPIPTARILTASEKKAAAVAAKRAAAAAEKEAALRTGKDVGMTEFWQEAQPGPVRYFVALNGYESVEVLGDVRKGQELHEMVTLVKAAHQNGAIPKRNVRHHSSGNTDEENGGILLTEPKRPFQRPYFYPNYPNYRN
jgi:hypothetical protein